MFRWYRDAEKCYVYLPDVLIHKRRHDQNEANWQAAFRNSRWFTRGWTLQELLAPKYVDFFSGRGEWLGGRSTLGQLIHEITEIPLPALCGTPFTDFSIEERMRWASKRNTKKKEDKAYCLLGIFGIFLPLIYGEADNAVKRLEEAIYRTRGESVRRKEQLLDSLNHGSPFTRVNNIPRCSAGTFEWIFDNGSPNQSSQAMSSGHLDTDKQADQMEWDKYLSESGRLRIMTAKAQLREWLSHGDGIFWIQGKPGSGKSTLMKFLAGFDNQNPRTLHCLQKRAGTQKPGIISFYFWLSDAQGIQNSFRGFLCHLLHQALSMESPEFAASLLTEDRLRQKKNLENWEPEELEGLFINVACEVAKKTPLCFMIDSLDECTAADQDRVIKVIKRLVLQTGSTIKACVSSRPEQRIEIRLQRLEPQVLELHNLTNLDIKRHVTDELDRCWRGGLTPTDQEKDYLVSQLVWNSQGVFLWAFLVTKRLCQSIECGDTISQLNHQLQELPHDMTNLYRAMLEKSDATKGHRLAEAASYFKFVIYLHRFYGHCDLPSHKSRYYTPCQLEDIDLCVPLYELHHGKIDPSHTAATGLVARRINYLCAGIMVARNPNKRSGVLQFFHRTARDFFYEPAANGILEHCQLTMVDIFCLIMDGICRNGHYPCPHRLDTLYACGMIEWLHMSEMKYATDAGKVKYVQHVNESMSSLHAIKNEGIKGDWVWEQSQSPEGEDNVLDFMGLSLCGGSTELLSHHLKKNQHLSQRYKDYLLLCLSGRLRFFRHNRLGAELLLELGANPTSEFYWGIQDRLRISPWLNSLVTAWESDTDCFVEIVEAFLTKGARLDDRTVVIKIVHINPAFDHMGLRLRDLSRSDISVDEYMILVIEVNAKYLVEQYYRTYKRRYESGTPILDRIDVQQTESYRRILLVRPRYMPSEIPSTDPIYDPNELRSLAGMNNPLFPENQQQFAEVEFKDSEGLLEDIGPAFCHPHLDYRGSIESTHDIISNIWRRSPKVNVFRYLEDKGYYKPADDPEIPKEPIPMYDEEELM